MRKDREALSTLAAAREGGDRPALVADEETVSWRQLGERVAVLVDEWRQTPPLEPARPRLPPRLGIVGHGDPATVTALLALIELGVPFLLLHPRSTGRERSELTHDTGAATIYGEREIGNLTRWARRRAESGGEPRVPGALIPSDDRPLALIHTSGTSGRPKAAVLSRRALLAGARASQRNLGSTRDDRWLLSLPLAHVGGLAIVIRALVERQSLVLQPRGSFRPLELRRRVEGHGVTLLSLVPTMLRRCLEMEPAWRDPLPLRAVLLGGAASPPRLLRRAASAGWPVLPTYGLTEACSQVATRKPGSDPGSDLGCGPPLQGVEVRIANGDPGRIQLRGRTLFSGYWRDGGVECPFDDDGWFDTGDHGRLDDDGNLHPLGRRLDLIVSGGENVYPLEVEQVLEEHPGIAAAAVFGVPDERWGERVVAALVASERPLDEVALVEFLADRVASYKRPRAVAWLSELPVTEAGKLDRAALRRLEGSLRPLGTPARR